MPQQKTMKSSTTDKMAYYDDNFFTKRAAWKSDYKAIASWIKVHTDAESYGDIGCGNGFLITNLQAAGKKVWGVDAAATFMRHVDPKTRSSVKRMDVSQPQRLAHCDVALCFEIAERISNQSADTLIQNTVSTQAKTIIFTAAEPGEAGMHHINLQPHTYWLDKFAKHGYFLDVVLTRQFKAEMAEKLRHVVWYVNDIMILQRWDSSSMLRAYKATADTIDGLTTEVGDLRLRNTKLKQEVWAVTQSLNAILNSVRWKASSKIISMVKR